MNGRTVSLRTAGPGDDAFFLEVYASTRAEELALVPWPAPQKEAFLRMQFAAQTRHYAGYAPPAQVHVVLVDGAPAGRLVLHRGEHDLHVVDIALLPSFRGKGVGTALLQPLLDEAAARGQRVSIHVELNNPARRLYERLGFVKVSEQGISQLMHREPPAPQPKTTE